MCAEILFLKKSEIFLIYNVVLVSSIQQSDPVKYTSSDSFPLFVITRSLNIVPCAVQ